MSLLGIFISEHRIAKHLSIRKLAELAKISHTEINRIENGERKNPSPCVLKAIALALNVKFDDIMNAAGYIDDELKSDSNFQKLSRIYELNQKELEEVSHFIDFLLNKREQNH